MSWNEPGGNKDPWSGRGQPTETPPDLEEVMKDINTAFGRLFGGSGGGGGSGGNEGLPFKAGGILIGAALLIWSLFGFYLVDEGSRGVVTRFGKYADTTLSGLHWRMPSPIETVQLVNLEQQRFVEVGYRSGGRQQAMGSVPKEALMLTQDENIIDIRLAVQYQIKDGKNYLFNVANPDETLKQVIESAQRAVIGKNTMDFVLTEGRGRIADEIKTEIQQIVDQYEMGIRISNVSLVDAQPPDEVQSAFEDAIKAREDEQRLKNEAEAYANEVVPKARGSAARLLEEAEAHKSRVISRAEGETGRFRELLTEYEKAPDITRRRMYLETMQEVMGQTDTVLVDVKNSGNMIYLPLDKIKRPASAGTYGKDYDSMASSTPDGNDNGSKMARSASQRGREARGQ
jgi:membrane protease subunit HflK